MKVLFATGTAEAPMLHAAGERPHIGSLDEDATQAFGADLIVMGSRGQTGRARFVAASVARRVLLGAKRSGRSARASAQLARDRDRTSLGALTPAGAP